MTSSLLQVGLVDFAEPALLLLGEAQSFTWLAQQISSRREIDFAKASNHVRQVGVSVRLIPTVRPGCLRRQAELIYWEVSAAEAKQFVQQLQELALSESPAHAYLDPQSNSAGVQVIASKGEYDPSKLLIA